VRDTSTRAKRWHTTHCGGCCTGADLRCGRRRDAGAGGGDAGAEEAVAFSAAGAAVAAGAGEEAVAAPAVAVAVVVVVVFVVVAVVGAATLLAAGAENPNELAAPAPPGVRPHDDKAEFQALAGSAAADCCELPLKPQFVERAATAAGAAPHVGAAEAEAGAAAAEVDAAPHGADPIGAAPHCGGNCTVLAADGCC
jgi:hypothetical protein